jgi:hypothetical protein
MPPICYANMNPFEVVFVINRTSDCSLSDELMNEPIEVPLEYTFALDSVLRKNSIQAGLSGGRLITTVKDLNEVITNHGNLVTVKEYSRLVSFGVVSDSSVARLPVQVVRNGVVHFTFDLTHESVMCELRLVWQQMGGNGENGGHSPDCHRQSRKVAGLP